MRLGHEVLFSSALRLPVTLTSGSRFCSEQVRRDSSTVTGRRADVITVKDYRTTIHAGDASNYPLRDSSIG